MWELDCEEGWALKNWCFWTVVLEKTLESPLDWKEIQPVYSEDQPWDFFGRNDAKAETLVLWPPHVKSWLIGNDPDAGRDWGQEEKGSTEDEMAGWHPWLDGHESEWTPGVGDGQGGLECCDSWGRKDSDTTEQLNWTSLNCGRRWDQGLPTLSPWPLHLCIFFLIRLGLCYSPVHLKMCRQFICVHLFSICILLLTREGENFVPVVEEQVYNWFCYLSFSVRKDIFSYTCSIEQCFHFDRKYKH